MLVSLSKYQSYLSLNIQGVAKVFEWFCEVTSRESLRLQKRIFAKKMHLKLSFVRTFLYVDYLNFSRSYFRYTNFEFSRVFSQSFKDFWNTLYINLTCTVYQSHIIYTHFLASVKSALHENMVDSTNLSSSLPRGRRRPKKLLFELLSDLNKREKTYFEPKI
jgi:hypothetical protein